MLVYLQRVALAASLLTLAACGSSHVQASGPQAMSGVGRPDRIIVEDFAVQSNAVTLDAGIGSRVARAAGASNAAVQQNQAANDVIRKLSEALVQQLNTTGIPTSPSSALPNLAPGYTSLVVSGKILSIDEGNRTRRTVVGFGVGQSKVTAQVDLYYATPGTAPRFLQTFTADSESGKKPGLAVAGAGAAAGSAATAVAVGAGSTVASEKFGATVEDDAGRMGKEIADTLRNYFVTQGWAAYAR